MTFFIIGKQLVIISTRCNVQLARGDTILSLIPLTVNIIFPRKNAFRSFCSRYLLKIKKMLINIQKQLQFSKTEKIRHYDAFRLMFKKTKYV